MKTVLVTGAKGFVGRNLCTVLRRRDDLKLFEYDIDSDSSLLDEGLASADVVLHLAGVNRPQTADEFQTGNAGFTGEISQRLVEMGRSPKLVITSSIQAALDNPYGLSKRGAEQALEAYSAQTGAEAVVYRLKNLFGKWGRPNYNSVTATFCHNIARDLPIQIDDPSYKLELTFIDDVLAAFVGEIDASPSSGFRMAEELTCYKLSLGQLAELIQSFHSHRQNLMLPDYSNAFVRALYATYLSYREPQDYEYGLDIKSDPRGSLAEFVKSPACGQIFVSHTKPGITRGNHYHHTKTEKFLVVQGEAVIRMRQIEGQQVEEFPVKGEDYRVVDIPPGYTHSIENIGDTEMVTLFWSSEVFNSVKPDTYFEPVVLEKTEL